MDSSLILLATLQRKWLCLSFFVKKCAYFTPKENAFRWVCEDIDFSLYQRITNTHASLKTRGNINSCSFSGVSFHKELNFNYSSVKLFSSPTNSRLFQHKQVSVEIKLNMKHSIIGNINGCVHKVFLLIVLWNINNNNSFTKKQKERLEKKNKLPIIPAGFLRFQLKGKFNNRRLILRKPPPR